MISHRHLAVAIAALGIGTIEGTTGTVEAQQSLPRPIVLYRPQPNSLQTSRGPTASSSTFRNVSSGGISSSTGQATSARPVTIVPGQPAAGSSTALGRQTLRPAGQQSTAKTNVATRSQTDPGSTDQRQAEHTPQENTTKTAEQEWAEQQARPTNQMLQNPSGAQSMTHSGMSSSQQLAPNTYLGPQNQNWSNQRTVGQMPASYGEMNRFQPTSFGGYVGPNTYVGSGFSNWSNLSQGGVSPGANGSWNFSVWP